MRARIASSLFVVGLVHVACGGATESNLFAGSDGGTGGDGGSSGGADGGPRPTLASLQTCSRPGTCELGATGCCGINCQPATQLIGIRRGEGQNVIAATCDQTGPVPCPACATQLDPNVQAFCESGKCTVVDLRTDDLSSCSNADDCVLRYATCCQSCEGGGVDQIVSIRKGREDDLEAQVCAGTERCDRCLPVFPPNVRATCNPTTRHCQVVTR
jgi:hypothetical protein